MSGLHDLLAAIAVDFRRSLSPFNPPSMVEYMLRRSEQFVIPGSY